MPVFQYNKEGLLPGRCSSTEYPGGENPWGASGCQELERAKKSRLGAWGPVLGEKRPYGNQSGLRQPRKCLACSLGLLAIRPFLFSKILWKSHCCSVLTVLWLHTHGVPYYQLPDFQSNFHTATNVLTQWTLENISRIQDNLHSQMY